MAGDERNTDGATPSPKVFRRRKSEILSSISLAVVIPLVVNTWKLRGDLQELIDAERAKTSQQISSSRTYANKRIQEFYREIKDDLGDVKDRIGELRSDVREIRVEVIRGSKK